MNNNVAYQKLRKVIFVERISLKDEIEKILEEPNGHFDLIINAVCPLGGFGNELNQNDFYLDYLTKRFLSQKNDKIINRLMDLFDLSFYEKEVDYALVIGPPASFDIVYPLILQLSDIYRFTPFFPVYKDYSFTVPINLDFDNAYGRFYGEIDQLKN